MAKKYTKIYQQCDFCKKEYEIENNGLNKIDLPGYYVREDGSQTAYWVQGDICKDCTQRLRKKLVDILILQEVAYGGTHIEWREDIGH